MTERAETKLRELVVREVGERGVATVAEIWTAVDAAGLVGDRVLLRQAIGRMVTGHILVSSGYGRYALKPGHHRRLNSVKSQTEELIAQVLRDHGGIARTKDIHDAIWDRPRGGRERRYQQQRITLALAKIARFRQDYGFGYWNLPADERGLLPILGKWAAYDIRAANDGCDVAGKVQEWFRVVGVAFADARGGCDVMGLVHDWAVAGALRELAAKAPGARADALDHAIRDGYKLLSSDNRLLLSKVYLLFERGDPTLHLVATAEFYRLCASRFGVDAAALSRGVVKRVIAADQPLPLIVGKGATETSSTTLSNEP